jgi:hypothetical protein
MATPPTDTPSMFEARLQDIQLRFRAYSPLSVLKASLDHLHEPTIGRHSRLLKHPWQILLLIKWVFLDPIASMPGRPAISRAELMGILQAVYELSNTGRSPTEYEDISLFLRAIAYQQFVHQAEDGKVDIARQRALFAQVPENHFFKTQFLRSTGVPVGDFLRLALTLTVEFGPGNYAMQRTNLFDIYPNTRPDVIDAFLRSISVDVNDLSLVLTDKDTNGRSADEFMQQTPFMRYPLVKVGSSYWCMSPYILQRSLGHFVYDQLKRVDIDKFNHPFGSAFEAYVKEQILQSALGFACEDDLIRYLPAGKVVDFLIADGDANVFIDAKGVEMAQRGRTAHRRDVVHQATRTSLVKAFEQGLDVCSRIAMQEASHPVIRPRSTNYLLAVTYKELYIGNGRMLAAAVGGDRIQQIRAQFDAHDLIPDENIYFLTVAEFELLMALVADGRIGLVQALDRAREADASPHTQKFTFEQHIGSWPESLLPRLTHSLDCHLGSLIEEMRRGFSG